MLEIAGIRKQNCILLSGEAGRSMSVLRGVFHDPGNIEIKPIGFAKAFVCIADNVDQALCSEGSPACISSCFPTTCTAWCLLDANTRAWRFQHVTVGSCGCHPEGSSSC